jgi:hypothetical protein
LSVAKSDFGGWLKIRKTCPPKPWGVLPNSLSATIIILTSYLYAIIHPS